jgi:hypothetical protein
LNVAATLFSFARMKATIVALAFAASLTGSVAAPVPLSDGKTFKGWFGDTTNTWRIEDGAFVGGSLKKGKVPRNEFLKTERSFTNFVLHVKVKLVGTNGFVNGGVQIRSSLVPPNEMKGYQCDVGEGWWGALYDESRRNKVLIKPNDADVKKAVKKDEWNDYVIRAEGKRIQTSINGVKMIDWTETDDSLPQYGMIGVQVHGGGVAEASYKDITIEELP